MNVLLSEKLTIWRALTGLITSLCAGENFLLASNVSRYLSLDGLAICSIMYLFDFSLGLEDKFLNAFSDYSSESDDSEFDNSSTLIP